MANGLSLKVLLELRKQGFDKGIASVKNSISSLRKTVVGLASTLVGGMGLSQLVTQFKSTAKELSQVQATLENVSDSSVEYGRNLAFLKQIANEYGQEQNALILSFAKFSAAAKASSMSLENQHKVFEALTKTAGAFHLTADQTSMAMLALEQMVSKGVVTSEELRRQLGQYIPGAVNIMAKAFAASKGQINGTIEDLQKAMKAGQVLSAEVLPYFADELNKVTQNASFESLVSSLNRFQNAWTDFVNESEFTGFYKKVVDAGTSSLRYLGDNFKAFGRLIKDVIAGASALIVSKLGKSLIEAGKKADPFKQHMKELRSELKAINKEIPIVNKEMQKAFDPKKGYQMTLNADELKKYPQILQTLSKEQINYLKTYNGSLTVTMTELGKQEVLSQKLVNLDKRRTEILSEISTFEGQASENVSRISVAYKGLLSVLKSVWSTIKAIGVQMLAAFAVGILVNFIQKMVEARKEAQRIADIPKTAEENWHKLSEETAKSNGKLEAQLAILKNAGRESDAYAMAIAELNKLLGRTGDKAFTVESRFEDIEQAVIEAKKQVIETNEEMQRLSELDRVSASIEQLTREQEELKESADWMKKEVKFDKWGNAFEQLTPKAQKLERRFNALRKEINQLIQAQQNLAKGGPEATGEGEGGGGWTKDQKAIAAEIDKYTNAQADLNTRKANGIITEKEYQQELKKTARDILDAIGSYKNLEDEVKSLNDTYYDTFRQIKKMGSAEIGGAGKTDKRDPILEAFKSYEEEKKKIDNLFKNGFIDEKTLKEKSLSLVENLEEVVGAQDDVESSVKSLGDAYVKLWREIEGGKDALKETVDALQKEAEEDEKAAKKREDDAERRIKYAEELAKAQKDMPGAFKDNRDVTFDYKKTQNDVDKEYVDAVNDYVKAWEQYIKTLEDIEDEFGDLGDAAAQALSQARDNLADAMKAANSATLTANLSEVIEDMTELKEKVLEGWAEEFDSIVGGFESITSSIESCRDAWEKLDDKQADGFDAIKAVLSTFKVITNAIETTNNAIKAFTVARQAMEKLEEANRQKEIVGEAAVAAAAQAAATAKAEGAAKSVAASAAEATAAQASASAEATNAAAKSASSVANIPYVGPILAVAAIASVVGALLAAFSKFANGGIVGGNSARGDRNLARVNSGEMILNKRQQANLLSMINNGGSGGKVEFVIRGDALKGVLQNHDRRLRG